MGEHARRSIGAELAIGAWGVLGVVAILADAIIRLIPRALEPLETGLEPAGVFAYVAAILALGYCEGYRGFQRSFSPRTVVRAMLVGRARGWQVLAAPLVAMGLVHATRRRLIASWSLVGMIVGFVLLVRVLPQPWRGAVDAGVIVGLGWGVVSLVLGFVGALRGESPDVEADFP